MISDLCFLVYVAFYLALGYAAHLKKVYLDIEDVVLMAVVSGIGGLFTGYFTHVFQILHPLYSSDPYPKDAIYAALFISGVTISGIALCCEILDIKKEVKRCR
jgi:hypothetical protein